MISAPLPNGANAPAAPGKITHKPFRLTRNVALITLGIIVLVSSISAGLLARFLAEQMLHRDAEVTMQFVQGLASVESVRPFFAGTPDRVDRAELNEFFAHLAALPDVLHFNVYSRERKVLWSSKREMIGKVLADNPELDEALEGELEVESDILEERKYLKPEHIYLPKTQDSFVENYIPVFDQDRRVLGVVEFYRVPKALIDTTHALIRRVWTSALAGGLILFASVFWLTRRADRLIKSQQHQLVETETLAALGEMAAAVAHSIRNPLASIRSSAELAQELEGAAVKAPLEDIMRESDRIAAWIKDLLTYAQPTPAPVRLEAVTLDRVITRAVQSVIPGGVGRHGIVSSVRLPADLPRVLGETNLLTQVFHTLVTNAVDAMPDGGKLSVSAVEDAGAKEVIVCVADTGHGMTREQVARAFEPFRTTKRGGLGVGLPLARRVLGRFGATLKIESIVGEGTKVFVTLRSAEAGAPTPIAHQVNKEVMP